MAPAPLFRSDSPLGPLKEGVIDVWLIPVDATESSAEIFLDILSDEERSRADRFRMRKDRERYLAGRGTLRRILGNYLNTAPGSLQFGYTEFGRPFLADIPEAQRPDFNISHSGNFIITACTATGRVGVDVEEVRPMPDAESIIRRFFSPAEQRAFLRVPREERDRAFFAGWTRKEAYIKAHGAGLSLPLDSFDVSLLPGNPEFLDIRDTPDNPSEWSLHEPPSIPGYAAAVAVKGNVKHVDYRIWEAWGRSH